MLLIFFLLIRLKVFLNILILQNRLLNFYNLEIRINNFLVKKYSIIFNLFLNFFQVVILQVDLLLLFIYTFNRIINSKKIFLCLNYNLVFCVLIMKLCLFFIEIKSSAILIIINRGFILWDLLNNDNTNLKFIIYFTNLFFINQLNANIQIFN